MNDKHAKDMIFQQPMPLRIRQSAWWLYQHELSRIDPVTGQTYISGKALSNALKWMEEQSLLLEILKQRPNEIQRRMLQMLAEGMSEKQIAHALGKNVRTTRVHFSRLRTRLGMETLYQLMAHSVEEGWVRLTKKDKKAPKSK
jgi:DNA-binding CsgD family transcriptional regulator